MLKLSELKKLHDGGFSLLYLREKQKRPFETNWTSSPNKTWDEIENSFEKKYNVGVRLGKHSKLKTGLYLGAIDCDVKSVSRKAKAEMNEQLRLLGIALDTAPIVISGRGNGSKHVYVQTRSPMTPLKFAQSKILVKCQMPSATPSKRDLEKLSKKEIESGLRVRPAWEIAFMGTGQQVVLPPSIHPDTGAAYAWANPMSVKYLPVFNPSKFMDEVQSRKEIKTLDIKFKAEKVNLSKTNLSPRLIKGIESGDDVQDRSAFLLSVTLSMCRAGFSDNQILSILTDEENWISEAAYSHTQSNNRDRAVRWLVKYTLTKARYETDIMRKFENKPSRPKSLPADEADAVEKELQAIQEENFPDLTQDKKPKNTQRNVVYAIEKRLGGAVIGLDEFSNRYTFLKNTEYGGKKGKELSDDDDLSLKYYMATHFRFEPSKDICLEAHTLVGLKNRFHPVRDYLDGLEWDEVPRLDQWLKRAFKATGPDEYLTAIGRKTLVAAIARVYEPGIKFDQVMILEGDQGKGKSTALKILAGGDKWFTDGIGDIFNKDVVDQMNGKWLIEFGELAQVRGREINNLKTFIARQVDRIRPPFGRRSRDFPRQSIFIGTTNDDEYLVDETGNRRFWPVKIRDVDLEWIKKNRDQLWAEAKMRYEFGEDIYLSQELEAIAQIEQKKRKLTDEWEHKIKVLIDDGHLKGKVTATMVFQAFEGNMALDPTMSESGRIGKVMRSLGYMRKSLKVGGVVAKGWEL